MGNLLSDVFDLKTIIINLKAKTRDEAFTELTDAIADVHPGCNREDMLTAIKEREKKMSTGVAPGFAIPHAPCRKMEKTVGAIGISRDGINYDALDKQPVHVVFLLVMSESATESHLKILNQIFRLTQSETLTLLRNAKNPQEIHRILSHLQF